MQNRRLHTTPTLVFTFHKASFISKPNLTNTLPHRGGFVRDVK